MRTRKQNLGRRSRPSSLRCSRFPPSSLLCCPPPLPPPPSPSLISWQLGHQLDVLSNFHFTPKLVLDDLTVRPNVPAISMEEVVPLASSSHQLQAPE
eukprot:310785-Hanusia_phi.AAC.1